MRWTRIAVTAVLAATAWAAPAMAQDYGGGRLPSAGVPGTAYVPTMGIALQARGDRMALRFDTSIRCGRTSYDIVGRTLGAFDGRVFSASASRRMRIPGGRIDYAWAVAGEADGTVASGTLKLTGTRVAGCVGVLPGTGGNERSSAADQVRVRVSQRVSRRPPERV